MTGRRKDFIIFTCEASGRYCGNSVIRKERISGRNAFSVCITFVTVFGITMPFKILPKGTHMLSPS